MRPLKMIKLTIARSKLSSRGIGSEANPLEAWIHGQVRKEFSSHPGLREAVGRSRLVEVTREDLEAYQLHRMREQMAYVRKNSIYYRRTFEEVGISPSDIQTFHDLTRVPLTEPEDLAEEPFHFLCVSQGKVSRPFTTSGTSGRRKRIFFTRDDLLRVIDAISAALRTVGMTEEDTLQIMFPTIASWDPGYMLDNACKIAGLNSVIADTPDVEEQLRIMRESGTSVLIGLTSFIHRITMLAREDHDLREMGIKVIILSAEPLPESMRREIERSWGCKALGQFGLTEMGLANAIECPVQDGLHVNEADLLVEVIDPDTGEHTAPMEEGELVLTSLKAQGTPLIRYRTYDLTSYIPSPCACGFATIGKIGKIGGRRDLQTKIGFGEKVYPLLFDEAILSVPGVVGYQTRIERQGFRDRLVFRVELIGDPEEGEGRIREAVKGLDEIRSGLERDLLEEPVVEVLEPGSVDYVPKSQLIVDTRERD
ncbi:MAG: phenylacetate--CoA ligase family protein [Methanomassiliicoccales archaeon]